VERSHAGTEERHCSHKIKHVVKKREPINEIQSISQGFCCKKRKGKKKKRINASGKPKSIRNKEQGKASTHPARAE
jgi:hypothetical protein